MEKGSYLLLLVSLVYLLSNASASGNGKVKITVGTTAGCGDTVNFIGNQLLPTYRQYGDLLEIEFVPWGRTQRDANGNFIFCQFGPVNCWANRMHRCALNMLKDDQAQQLEFMSCDFSPPYPGFLQQSYACAEAMGLKIEDLDSCVNNPHLDTLDDEAEAASAEPMAVINFVPSIVVNDNINLGVHFQALASLSSVVCRLLVEDPSSGISVC